MPITNIRWSEQIPSDCDELPSGRCDYCGLGAVCSRSVLLPEMTGVYRGLPTPSTIKWSRGKPPKKGNRGKFRFRFVIEFCSECDNRFRNMRKDARPVPGTVAQMLCQRVDRWALTVFPSPEEIEEEEEGESEQCQDS